MNQYDSQAMLECFEKKGYLPAAKNGIADIYVVNTCTVTGTGDQKSMQWLRRCQQKNPMAEIVVVGCLAQRKGEALRETGARLILGTQYRTQIVELFEKAMAENTQIVAVERLDDRAYESLFVRRHAGHTRAIIKIQEGCDNYCTYCIVPSVRGSVRSRDLASIQAEVLALAQAGFREIVLTGVHLSSYGLDLPERPSLVDAINIMCKQEGVARVRLGSLEPRVVNHAFKHVVENQHKLCRQFHLPLQSGSDNILRRMKRGYNAAQFLLAANMLKGGDGDIALTTDVIVGFPGETDEDFRATLALCAKVGFAKMHVFPYSKRDGTPAAAMACQLNAAIKKERVREAIELGTRLATQYRQRQLDTVREVLLEKERESGEMEGYTSEYVRTVVRGGEVGQVVQVRLEALMEEGMRGRIVEM